MKAFLERSGDPKEPAPVHLWKPDYTGELDMRIASDGSWYYQGGRIERDALVRLFSTILRRETDGRHVLVTPVECYGIDVEDAAFTAVELEVSDEDRALVFRTNVGDVVTVDDSHPLRFSHDDRTAGFKPYVMVRHGLEALLTRPVVHQLLEHAVERDVDGVQWFGVESRDHFFPIARLDEIEEEIG